MQVGSRKGYNTLKKFQIDHHVSCINSKPGDRFCGKEYIVKYEAGGREIYGITEPLITGRSAEDLLLASLCLLMCMFDMMFSCFVLMASIVISSAIMRVAGDVLNRH